MNDYTNPYAPPATVAAPITDEPPTDAIPAGFAVRAGARLVDFVVVFVVSSAAGAIAGALVAALAISGVIDPSAVERVGELSGGAIALSTGGNVLYHTLAEGIGGASIGKLAFGLRVRRETLARCTLGAALGRSLAYFIDSLCFAIPAYSSMASSPMKQRYGDKWAHTVVVTAASLGPSARGNRLVIGILASLAVAFAFDFVSIAMKAF